MTTTITDIATITAVSLIIIETLMLIYMIVTKNSPIDFIDEVASKIANHIVSKKVLKLDKIALHYGLDSYNSTVRIIFYNNVLAVYDYRLDAISDEYVYDYTNVFNDDCVDKFVLAYRYLYLADNSKECERAFHEAMSMIFYRKKYNICITSVSKLARVLKKNMKCIGEFNEKVYSRIIEYRMNRL